MATRVVKVENYPGLSFIYFIGSVDSIYATATGTSNKRDS